MKIISVAIATLFFALNITQVAIASDTKSRLWPQYSDKTICRLAKTGSRTDGYFYEAALRGLDCKDVPSAAVTFPVSSKAMCVSNDSLKWSNCLGSQSLPVRCRYCNQWPSWRTGVYIGEWLNGKYHGKGLLIDNHEGIFVSEWKEGVRTGLGRLWYLGDYSSGKDVSGKKYKELYFESPVSQRYRGDDHKRAFIERVYEDTSASKLVYKDGSVYRGGYRFEDMPWGAGTRSYPNGKVVSGAWERGELTSNVLPSVHSRAMYEAKSLENFARNISNKELCAATTKPHKRISPSSAQLVLIMRGMVVKNCLRRNPSMGRNGGDPSKLLFTETNELVATPPKPVPVVKKSVKLVPVEKKSIKPIPVVKTPTKPAPVVKTAPKNDEVLSTSSSYGADKIFMICKTEAMGERRVANGYAFHAEIDLVQKRLNWNGWKSNELKIEELRFFAIMECITPINGGCILPFVAIDRLTGGFRYQTWGDDGEFNGTCRVSDKKKKLF